MHDQERQEEVKLLYAFPEPLPLNRARGVQVAHAVANLAKLGVALELVYVPGVSMHPLAYYGLSAPAGLTLTPLSRSLPWPLHRVHSNRLFLFRLGRRIAASPRAVLFVRHLKLAVLLLEHYPSKKLVYEAHEVFSDTGTVARRKANFAMEALVMRKAALVIANSAATATRLSELHGPRKIEVLANGVDWQDMLPEKNWKSTGLNIIYAGSLFGWKGAEDLVDAAAALPGCRIAILGGRAEEIARLRAKAPAGGAKVEFLGQLPHAEVALALQSACIAVLPNRDGPDSRFTSPIKLFEYMAAGCAIVVSDLPPMREILDEEDAMWTIPGNPKSIAAAIASLVADPARACRMGERVRLKAERFTWRARAGRLIALLAGMDGHK